MHSPHATWETGLVIPEQTKPIDVQTLDVLLRIEALLTKLVRAKALEDLAAQDGDELTMSKFASKEDLEDISTLSPADIIEKGFSKPKGKRTRGQ
jgi:hypothetical protein